MFYMFLEEATRRKKIFLFCLLKKQIYSVVHRSTRTEEDVTLFLYTRFNSVIINVSRDDFWLIYFWYCEKHTERKLSFQLWFIAVVEVQLPNSLILFLLRFTRFVKHHFKHICISNFILFSYNIHLVIYYWTADLCARRVEQKSNRKFVLFLIDRKLYIGVFKFV